jgi:predicted metal-binding membrane protein
MAPLDLLPRVLTVVCQPTFGIALMPDGTAWGASGLALVLLMWMAMALAMMLPSAGPMILTYAEIAETAARKGQRIVSPFVLAGGYAVVWFAFAVAAALAQFIFTCAALLNASMASASALFSGAIFIGAGFYQFSALKHACLTQCRSPFPFFFTRWETKARGVFRLGVEQGVFCLGCCWAMMLVMFAVGVMNVVWMAALGVVMTVEKMLSGKRFTHAVGVVMIVIGVAVVALSVAAHWPVHHV